MVFEEADGVKLEIPMSIAEYERGGFTAVLIEPEKDLGGKRKQIETEIWARL